MGKVWHKVHLDFQCQGLPTSADFLVCPIGDNKAILGMPWLKTINPDIDWKEQTVTLPETVQITSEEEADENPLEGLPEAYHEFTKVFGEEEFKVLPPHRPYDLAIELKEGAKLHHGPLYSMTELESQALKKWIDEELATGKIRRSESEAGALVMFVKKADGSLRLVVDYRRLNEVTKKNVYPLPRQDNLTAQLQGAKIFTKLDLCWGYNNVRIKEGDEYKTAFRTKYGLFETLAMPFGLTNAPAAFQHFMNDIFWDMLDTKVVIYLDDILIFSKAQESHRRDVKEVLRRLAANQLFCKLSKCSFHVDTVDYLGLVISPRGISMEEKKIQAVKEWPTPQNVKQVQSFLGFANFLQRFVPNYSTLARPLHNRTHKEAKWEWGDSEQKSFEAIKEAICQRPVLAHPDPSKQYYLETDVSGAAMGAILSQRQEDGRLHPIVYMSQSFSRAKHNYDTHDKELLAIIKALEFWRIFLEGTKDPITIFTDHRNLEYWQGSRTFNRRHAWWHLLLANYNFRIHYRPGKQSGKLDALSRRSDHLDIAPEPQIMLPKEVFASIATEPEVELQTRIEKLLDQDESLEEILEFLQSRSSAPAYIRKGFKDYQMEASLLFYQGKIVVSDNKDLKRDIISAFHDSPIAGHPGQQRTLELVSRRYYWPGMRAQIFHYVETCEICQRIKRPKHSPIPVQPLEVPTWPWQHISYDMIVGLPLDGVKDAILVIVDSFSKYGIMVPCSSKVTTKDIADLFLDHVWKRHGFPEKTISDRGPVFNNKYLKALYDQLGIKAHFSLAYHPQSDRQTEQMNPGIEQFLRAYAGMYQKDWVKWLPMAEFSYNNAVHSATGTSPFRCLYGRDPVMTPSKFQMEVPEANNMADTLQEIWEETGAALRLAKERMAGREPGEVPETFDIGEKVWLDSQNLRLKTNSTKLTDKPLGPFKVLEKLSDLAYRLELPEHLKIHNVFYVGL
jgi:hypothetical protein